MLIVKANVERTNVLKYNKYNYRIKTNNSCVKSMEE